MKFDFNANREQAEKEYNLGKGQSFKPKEGANKLRLVSPCLAHPGEFKGTPTFKWLCQILDYTDGQVKPYFMPDVVYKAIMDLQLDPDYSFDEVPMPYSINIQTKNAGKKEVVYTVIPSPKRIPLTAEELRAIEAAPSVEELQAKIKGSDGKPPVVTDEQKEKEHAEIEAEINPEEIPF
jgi:hypothetical protein